MLELAILRYARLSITYHTLPAIRQIELTIICGMLKDQNSNCCRICTSWNNYHQISTLYSYCHGLACKDLIWTNALWSRSKREIHRPIANWSLGISVPQKAHSCLYWTILTVEFTGQIYWWLLLSKGWCVHHFFKQTNLIIFLSYNFEFLFILNGSNSVK